MYDDVASPVGLKFPNTFLQFAHRQQSRALDFHRVVLIPLAAVEKQKVIVTVEFRFDTGDVCFKWLLVGHRFRLNRES